EAMAGIIFWIKREAKFAHWTRRARSCFVVGGARSFQESTTDETLQKEQADSERKRGKPCADPRGGDLAHGGWSDYVRGCKGEERSEQQEQSYRRPARTPGIKA